MGFIITFYSYKGGVGRTMSLANIAALLSRKDKKVLMVDWDLEAPGLELYFKEFDIKLSKTEEGLLELLENVVAGKQADWHEYISEIAIEGKYPLNFLRSGSNDPTYPQRVLDFDWTTFYKKHEGGEYIELLREAWQEEYDVVLIDSRTGFTDAGGICTIQLPDVLVLVFTANEQSLIGVKDIAIKAQKGRQKLFYDRMPLLIFPMLARFEGRTEFEDSQEWLKKISNEMASFYDDWLPKKYKPIQVLEQTKLPYVAYFSFGEKLAVVSQGISDPESLGYAYNVLTKLIEGEFQNINRIIEPSMAREIETTKEQVRKPKIRRSKVSGSYGSEYAYDIYISYKRDSIIQPWVKNLLRILEYNITGSLGRHVKLFYEISEADISTLWPNHITQALNTSRLLVPFLTVSYFRSQMCMMEWKTFIKRSEFIARRPLILPLHLQGGDMFPEEAKNLQWFDVSKYFFTSSAFWETTKAVELESVIRDFAELAAEMITNAPPFNPEWPVVSTEELNMNIPPMIEPPTLK